jgi:hypothetical protein
MIPLDLPSMDADILARVVVPTAPTLPEASAKTLLELQFDARDVARMNELAAKNRQDELTQSEERELESFLRIGHLLDLIQAKALVSLQQH